MKVVKRVLVGLVAIVITLLIWHNKLVYYGFVQANGQLKIISNAQPLENYLNDPDYPDSLKAKIELILEVREFAFDQLGIKKTDNYTTMYDQKNQPLMWVVTGCEPFSLTPHTWNFPWLGSVPYKGFFDQKMAQDEMQRVNESGFDVGVRNPGGWSTLGWFNDPVLSNMLDRNYGQLAELIIHELTHSTIFVKDSVTFNENLASFIGHQGSVMFLKKKFGDMSVELTTYLNEERDYNKYANHFIRGTQVLDSLYNSFPEQLDVQVKTKQKEEAIKNIISQLDTIEFASSTVKLDSLFASLPNNTYFMSFLRYKSRQDDFENEFSQKFEKDLKRFIVYYKEKYPFV